MRDQQVHDVAERDEQQRGNGGGNEPQRRSRARDQLVLERAQLDCVALAVRAGMTIGQHPCDRRQLAARIGDGDAGPQPGDGVQPPGGARRLPRRAGANDERDPVIVRRGRIPRRQIGQHADDAPATIVEHQRLADDIGAAGELAPPERVREHHRVWRGAGEVVGDEEPAELGANAEHVVEIACDAHALEAPRIRHAR